MVAAKRKVEGPFKVASVGEQWKVVRVIGKNPSLEVIESHYQREMEQKNARPARPARPGGPVRPARPAIQPHDDAYWAQERAQAGQDVTRDIDGGKLYPQRQGAYRRSLSLNEQYNEDLQSSYEKEQEETMIEEPTSDYIPQDQITQINILRGTFGCPSGDHADIDPYYDRYDWSEAARGDGGSYGGVLDTIYREDDELWDSFYARAQKRANVLDAELGCSRCSYE